MKRFGMLTVLAMGMLCGCTSVRNGQLFTTQNLSQFSAIVGTNGLQAVTMSAYTRGEDQAWRAATDIAATIAGYLAAGPAGGAGAGVATDLLQRWLGSTPATNTPSASPGTPATTNAAVVPSAPSDGPWVHDVPADIVGGPEVIPGMPRCWVDDTKTGGNDGKRITQYVQAHGGVTLANGQWTAVDLPLAGGRTLVPYGFSIGSSSAPIQRVRTIQATGSDDRSWWMLSE